VGNDVVDAAAGGLDALAEDDGEVALGGGLGSDVVGLVVLGAAGDGHAAGNGRLGLRGVHHDDPVSGRRVDDGRDVEEVGTAIAVEGELGKDAWDVGLAIVIGVGIASPALRELLGDLAVAFNGELVDLSEPLGGSEDDVTSDTVLVDELGAVLRCHQGRESCEEEGLGELHLEKMVMSVLKRSYVVKCKRGTG
jgi:hypothetical protein